MTQETLVMLQICNSVKKGKNLPKKKTCLVDRMINSDIELPIWGISANIQEHVSISWL